MRAALGQTADLLRLFWRHERSQIQHVAFSGVILPGTIAYMGVMVVEDPVRRTAWLAGAVTFGLGMSAVAVVGFGILWDRFSGRLALLRSLPLSKGAYFASHVLVAMLESVLVVIVAVVGLGAAGVIQPGDGALPLGVGMALCAGASLGGFGALIASRARDFDSGNTTVMVLTMALAFLSPVFYPASLLPWPLQAVSWLSPFTHVAPVLRALFSGGAVPLAPLLGTLALAAVFSTASYRMLRWQA